MDIQAPYITEMMRKGYCDEYDAYYGINRSKQAELKPQTKRFVVEIDAVKPQFITASQIEIALTTHFGEIEAELSDDIYESLDVEEE